MKYFKGKITNFYKMGRGDRKVFDIDFHIRKFKLSNEIVFMMKTKKNEDIKLKIDEKEFESMLNNFGYYKKD